MVSAIKQGARPVTGLLAMPFAVLTLAIAGCSDQAGLGPNGLQPAATGSLNTSSQPKRPFNPFSEAEDTTVAQREVIKNPTVAEVMQPGPLPEMAMGRADAPVTIIKYASLTCPYCRKFQIDTFPELKRRYIDTGKVRFILREFPIGFQSGAATVALRCAPPSKYFDLYDRFLRQQGKWVSQEVRTEPIFQIAKQVGVTRTQYEACRKNQGMIDGLKAVKDRGRTLGIIGTPNFFVNGRLYKQVLTMADIRSLVDEQPGTGARVAGTAPAR
jgi:protein-disulfide isomerase